MNELKLTNKEVAAAVHDELKRAGEDVKFETIVGKLSKLLHDDPEGSAFFLKNAARTGALALAIESDAEQLRALADRTALVLDPRLTDEVAAYLRERSESGVPVACVSVEVGANGSGGPGSRRDQDGRTREALRDEARKHPRAVVVTVTSDDDDFYRGADIRATRVEAHPRGFVLLAAPDLVPLPPPAPPELWRAGEPRVPCALLTSLFLDLHAPFGDRDEAVKAIVRRLQESHRHLYFAYDYGDHSCNRRDVLFQTVRDALEYHEKGSEPTYSLEELWPFLQVTEQYPPLRVLRWDSRYDRDRLEGDVIWFANVGGGGSELEQRLTDVAVRNAFGFDRVPTVAWTYANRVFVIGPLSERFRAALAPHHVVEMPEALAALAAGLSGLNPWRALVRGAANDLPEGTAWRAVREGLLAECGLDLTDAVTTWRSRDDPEPAVQGNRNRPPEAPQRLQLLSGDALRRARVWLEAVAAREFEGTVAQSSIPFRVERAARSLLVALPSDERDELHVLADLGGGHLLRVRGRRFREAAAPLRILTDGEATIIDGGDVRLWLRPSYDSLLEGPGLRARARRREEEAEAEAAADWDD